MKILTGICEPEIKIMKILNENLCCSGFTFVFRLNSCLRRTFVDMQVLSDFINILDCQLKGEMQKLKESVINSSFYYVQHFWFRLLNMTGKNKSISEDEPILMMQLELLFS